VNRARNAEAEVEGQPDLTIRDEDREAVIELLVAFVLEDLERKTEELGLPIPTTEATGDPSASARV
jgi:hypothetical protein